MTTPRLARRLRARLRRNQREGFALPMAILVIAFLTVTIAAAYAATTAEMTTNLSQRGESRAYMLAQAGMENFMARRNENGFCANCGLPPTVTYESTTVSLPGGYAQVVAQRVRVATDTRPAIYLLRAKGVDTLAFSWTDSAGSKVKSYGIRTVAQLTYWNVNQVNVLSGWTALNGLSYNGSAGTITGLDGCGAKSTVAGIAVPGSDYNNNGNFTPQGNPPIQSLGTMEQAKAAIKIDWDGIVNGNRIQADYVFATNAAAQAGWPSINFSGRYPVIRVNDNFTMPTTGGQGTLIVLGNLTISGNNLWNGIILVGGTMTSNGNGTMEGATESGLNAMLKTSPSPSQLDSAQMRVPSGTTLTADPANSTANGTKTFQYNSCEVAKAAGGLASYSVYPNAWMDNFVTY